MAKNLSALKATTPKNEAKANKFAVIRYAMDMVKKVGLFPVQVSCSNFVTRLIQSIEVLLLNQHRDQKQLDPRAMFLKASVTS